MVYVDLYIFQVINEHNQIGGEVGGQRNLIMAITISHRQGFLLIKPSFPQPLTEAMVEVTLIKYFIWRPTNKTEC